MRKRIAVATFAAALFLMGAGCAPANPAPPTSAQGAQAPGQNSNQPPRGGGRPSPYANENLTGQNIKDTRYGQYAYLISEGIPDGFDAKTKEALAGFTVDTKTGADGVKTITLNATNPEYQNQTYALQPGQKLYFIEMSLGDDRDGQEYSLRDDHAIVTDKDGVIVEQK